MGWRHGGAGSSPPTSIKFMEAPKPPLQFSSIAEKEEEEEEEEKVELEEEQREDEPPASRSAPTHRLTI